MQQRIYFLDNLKLFIVWLMVVFHIAMSYMAYVPEWWYVIDGDSALSGTVFVIWADVFIMPVMFFVSGYFGLNSLSRQSPGRFWRSKWKRIGLPWIFGAMVIAPYIAYLTFASRGIPMSYGDFYIEQFWGPFYQHGHYWYLGFLMCLYLLLFILCNVFPGLKQRCRASHPSALLFGAVFVICAASMAVINSYVPDAIWIHPLYLIVMQPTRALIYVVYFLLGAYAWRRNWFSSGGYRPTLKIWLPLFAVMSVVLCLHRLSPGYPSLSPEQYIWLNAAIHSLFCLSAIFGLLALFCRCCNFTTGMLTSFAATSYAVYYVHQIFAMNSVWFLRSFEINICLKYIIACIFTLTASHLLSKYLLMRLPCFAVKKK